MANHRLSQYKMESLRKEVKKTMESTTLIAPDISCEMCQRAIEGAVGKLAGVERVQVDIPTTDVHVTYDPETITLAQIEEVLDDTGYTVAK